MQFIKELWSEKKLVWELAKNDCKARFSSSALGAVWTFLQPLINILVIWYVFEIGFKNPPVDDVPFIVWYLPAFLSWNFFSEGLSTSTTSLLEYSYLVKKVNFKVSIIPVIKIVSAALIHFGFILFIMIVNFLYGIKMNVYYLQAVYYFFSMFVLMLGLGWLFASISVFLSDFSNIISIIIQTGFWATPIFWDPRNMEPVVQKILKFNPMYYITQGYRDSFVFGVGVWERPKITLYFWIVTIVIFVAGTYMYKKLRPQFDDVL